MKIKGSTANKNKAYANHIDKNKGIVTYMLPVEAFAAEIKFFDL